ncbi:keratin-associated protein 19-2-like [Pogoniulus pusillus]|uniref:keratin-associated protein 19-2-like n=1 Tax=Pogoniulus pusillus TaxID=488313 RepID=UPI0030B98EF0
MTFYRDSYNNACCSLLACEDLYGFGGLNGYRFGSPYGYYREQCQYSSPYGYRSFGSLGGSRGLSGFGGFYGYGDRYGDLYGFGFGYPFSGFGSGAFY